MTTSLQARYFFLRRSSRERGARGVRMLIVAVFSPEMCVDHVGRGGAGLVETQVPGPAGLGLGHEGLQFARAPGGAETADLQVTLCVVSTTGLASFQHCPSQLGLP